MPFRLTFKSFPHPDGPLSYAEVPWDSALYGFPFYEFRCGDNPHEVLGRYLSSWLLSLPGERACLVCAKISTRAVALCQVLTQHGFYPVETMLEIYLPLSRLIPVVRRQPNKTRLRLAVEAEMPQIIAIARSAFSSDRLHLDPNLPPEKADQRYVQWVEHGFRAGEPVFIYEDVRSAKVLGFLHVRETSPKTVDLSLGAVDVAFHGTGIGGMMYQAVSTECRARGYQIATTRISVNNLDIVNLFSRLGFAFSKAVAILHWYRTASEGEPYEGQD